MQITLLNLDNGKVEEDDKKKKNSAMKRQRKNIMLGTYIFNKSEYFISQEYL